MIPTFVEAQKFLACEAHPLVEVEAGGSFEDEAIPDSVYIATPQGAYEPILWKTLIHEDKDEYKIEL